MNVIPHTFFLILVLFIAVASSQEEITYEDSGITGNPRLDKARLEGIAQLARLTERHRREVRQNTESTRSFINDLEEHYQILDRNTKDLSDVDLDF